MLKFRLMQAAVISEQTGHQPNIRPRIKELLRAYAEDGYIVLPGIVPQEGLAVLTTQLSEALAQFRRTEVAFNGGGFVAGHINCSPGEPSRFAYDALEAAGVIDFVRAVSPAFVEARRIGCNLNLPGSVAQNWHIDGEFKRDFLVVNVAVVDTNLVNGAIDILPKSHHVAQPYWRMALKNRFADNARIQMKRGDVMVRTSRLWHRGMPNRSQVVRPMIGFTFGEGNAETSDPFAAGGGAIGFSPNRFRTDMLGQLRERTYVAMPFAHNAFRLVRSFLGKDGYA
jgi:hypothetical protein